MPMELNEGNRPELYFITEKVLNQTIEVYHGLDMNVVVSVSQDGNLSELAGTKLFQNIDAKPQDVAVMSIAYDLQSISDTDYGRYPTLLRQKIDPRYITPQLKKHFEKGVVETIEELKGGSALLLDLQGFSKQPEGEEYDLIIGTAHRKSVRGTSIDIHFAEFMSKKGYNLYVPTEQAMEGELYTAEDQNSLVQIVTNKQISNVFSLQIEIARHFGLNTPESIAKGKQLAMDLSAYLIDWEEGLKIRKPQENSNIIRFPISYRLM